MESRTSRNGLPDSVIGATMPVKAIPTTTLSAAIDGRTRTLYLASTAGVVPAPQTASAGVPTTVFVINNEQMWCMRVPNAVTAEVFRGWGGTAARAHPAGSTVYIADGASIGGQSGETTTLLR